MSNPKIIIQFNRFLDPIFTGYIQAQPQWKDWVPPQKERVLEGINMYKKEWEKYGEKVLTAMQEITKLYFFRNEIQVHVVSGNSRPFSSPIILKSTYSAVDFINILTHELIHCLFRDNEDKIKGRQFYSHENQVVANHVIVHAILKYIYIDILDEPERVDVELKFTENSKHGYDIAWKIVQENDYMKLISQALD